MKEKKWAIPALVVVGCCLMGLVDGVIQPGYWTKSGIKILLFLGLPLAYGQFFRGFDPRGLFRLEKRGLVRAVAAGVGVYVLILGAFLVLKDVFDFSRLTASVTAATGVKLDNFLWVAVYISFVNSLLEEFFFRGFAFLTLKKKGCGPFAWAFSSIAFSLYHGAMMIGWFDWYVAVLALAGLAVGGLIFNWFDHRSGTLYPSWLVHMGANFATNTIGLLLFLE